jgi:Mce-associated membrane protein
MTQQQPGHADDDQRDIADPAAAPEPPPTDEDSGTTNTPAAEAQPASEATTPTRRVYWLCVLVYGLLPGLALLIAIAAGLLKWQYSSLRDADISRTQSVEAAKGCAVALLTFRPDTVENDVQAALDRLTGEFLDSYQQTTREVLIPDVKEQQVFSTSTDPVAAPVSVNDNHAVVLLFVDQTMKVGDAPPARAPLSVRMKLDKIGERWLVSEWDPVS